MMKKLLIIATAFCLCLSLVAAEGEAGAETKKDQKPYWTSENLLYGPGMTFLGLFCINPLVWCCGATFVGCDAFWFFPLVAPMMMVDGVIHTATFGLLYNNRTGEDYIMNCTPGLGKYWKNKKESKSEPKVEDAWQ
ncbi:hypothetical protein J5754_02375 [bacterium]|nr:hypothetical protein [bacterium]